MSDAMTVEEAVRVLRDVRNVVRADGTVDSDLLHRAESTVLAHAERTVEARGGEPEFVAAMREAIGNCPSLFANEAVLMSHIDHLTARAEKAEADNTFARAEWAHWEAEACRIEKERKALEARLAEVERERDEARVERDFLVDEYERALRIEPRGWAHAAGHLYNAIVNAKFEANWKYSEKLRTDRDALAGIVDPCAKFVAQALDDHTTARWWADADMQDHLKAHGFLAEERVTEDVIAKCGGSCECDVGYNCYRFTPLAQAVRDRALTPTREGA
jgi:hypothetical protein